MLTQVTFPRFIFELDSGFNRFPFRFPELDIKFSGEIVNHKENDEAEDNIVAIVTMEIRSEQYSDNRNGTEDEEQEGEEDFPAVKLSIDAIAFFECHEGFSDCRQALEQFVQADTPGSIMLPYVRAFIANVLPHTGLPNFHLPLTQVSTSIDETKLLEEKAEE